MTKTIKIKPPHSDGKLFFLKKAPLKLLATKLLKAERKNAESSSFIGRNWWTKAFFFSREVVTVRVARFFLVQHTKTGEIYQNDHNFTQWR
jgi:hypothetical protein